MLVRAYKIIKGKNLKKTIFCLLILSSTLFAQEKKECKIFSSPAINFDKVFGTDILRLNISKVYYDKNKKLQVRSFTEAAEDFNRKAKEFIYDECKKYKIKMIYNYTITHSVDENYFNFIAQYDFGH